MNNSNKITPVILAGGLGTRLRSVVSDKPKVLAPVNNRPFLSYLLDQLILTGFNKVVLCTGYKGQMVEEAFGPCYRGLNIIYSREQTPLGTGGALRKVIPLIDEKIVFIMNGDSYVDFVFLDFLDWYLKEKINAAILLTNVSDTSCFGSVKISEKGKVLRFSEKQRQLAPGMINAGIYILKTTLLKTIPPDTLFSLEKEFFPSLIGKDFYGFPFVGDFVDIGTPESYSTFKKLFRSN